MTVKFKNLCAGFATFSCVTPNQALRLESSFRQEGGEQCHLCSRNSHPEPAPVVDLNTSGKLRVGGVVARRSRKH
jgi:hypothetical protein